jgi:acyl carrier protein
MSQITVPLIVECVRTVANKDVAPDMDIFSAGVDSLAVLRCRGLLKAQTGVKVPGHVFFSGRTPAGIVGLIEAQNLREAQNADR